MAKWDARTCAWGITLSMGVADRGQKALPRPGAGARHAPSAGAMEGLACTFPDLNRRPRGRTALSHALGEYLATPAAGDTRPRRRRRTPQCSQSMSRDTA